MPLTKVKLICPDAQLKSTFEQLFSFCESGECLLKQERGAEISAMFVFWPAGYPSFGGRFFGWTLDPSYQFGSNQAFDRGYLLSPLIFGGEVGGWELCRDGGAGETEAGPAFSVLRIRPTGTVAVNTALLLCC